MQKYIFIIVSMTASCCYAMDEDIMGLAKVVAQDIINRKMLIVGGNFQPETAQRLCSQKDKLIWQDDACRGLKTPTVSEYLENARDEKKASCIRYIINFHRRQRIREFRSIEATDRANRLAARMTILLIIFTYDSLERILLKQYGLKEPKIPLHYQARLRNWQEKHT